MEHVAGARNYGPDALSRFPVGGQTDSKSQISVLSYVNSKDQEWSDTLEAGVVAAVVGRVDVKVVSWQVVRQHGMSDPVYLRLLEAVGSDHGSWDGELEQYRRYRDGLSVADGVVLHEGRIVVPEGLRGDVLGALHRAHQGATGMMLRAATTVWWPGLSVDIGRIRDLCRVCARNAPS